MNLKDIFTFQLKRVNPFPGLAIDADTWRDAHDYSRNQQRLHNLLFHQVGIIQGLEVTSNDPDDLSVNIHPGVAVDPLGNIIIVQNIYHYQIQNRDRKTVYLVIQFREVLEGPYQPPEGGQPTRIVDGYRIQERDDIPDEPHLELARIDLDPAKGTIKDAKNKKKPASNEINLNYRIEATNRYVENNADLSEIIPQKIIETSKKVKIGYCAVDDKNPDLHIHGLRNLVREMEMRYNYTVELDEEVILDENITTYSVIYLTGGTSFNLSLEQVSILESFIKSNGILFAEDCHEGIKKSTDMNGNRTVYNELTKKLKLKLKPVNQGNHLLSDLNVFSEAPQGMKSGVLLEGNNVVYTDNDYGCAWQGGYRGNPVSRDIIRSAFEIGANILDYAYKTRTSTRQKKLLSVK